MKNKRREFLKQTALTGLAAAGGMLKGFGAGINEPNIFSNSNMEYKNFDDQHLSVIGLYGDWAAGLNKNELPSFSFRRNGWKNISEWRKAARKRLRKECQFPILVQCPA